MLIAKQLDIAFRAVTFPGGKVPPILAAPSALLIDVGAALFLLGDLTIPGGLSSASPARTWGWIRYYSAVAVANELCITTPFVDLDPHQKTILSDDFGVALTMQWLNDRLGGFRDVVDGRRFVRQFGPLLAKPKKNTPKVGRGKCPDFVVLDAAGKWHVIECNGTQTSRYYRNQQVRDARVQKGCIDIVGNLKGFSLAAGVYVGAESNNMEPSELLIADPEVDPYVTIGRSTERQAKEVTRRLAVSRALGLAGVSLLSQELALPADVGGFEEFFSTGERRRLARPRTTRSREALEEIRAFPGRRVQVGPISYRTRAIEVELPGSEFRSNTGGCTRIRVQQGVNEELLEALLTAGDDVVESVDLEAERFLPDAAIDFEVAERSAILRQGSLFFAQLEFLD